MYAVHIRTIRTLRTSYIYARASLTYLYKCGLNLSESDGSAIFGGTDALAEDIIALSDAFVAVYISIINFNCKMVAVVQALKQATDMVERPRAGNSSLATVASPTTGLNLDDLEIPDDVIFSYPCCCIYSLPLF